MCYRQWGIIVCCLCMWVTVQAQEPDSLVDATGVKHIMVQTYKVDDATIKKGRVAYMEQPMLKDYKKYDYDTAGRIITMAQCTKEGIANDYYTYVYNKKGLCVERVRTMQQQVFGGRHTYDYDMEGRKIRTTIYDGNNSLYRTITYKYKEGRICDEKTFNAANMVIYHRQSDYNADGNMIYFVNNSTGLVKDNDKYSYKQEYEQNRLVKKEYYNAGDTMTTWWEYRYDNAGRLLSEKQYDDEGTAVKAEYKSYDKRGNMLTHQINDVLSKSRIRMVYAYNKDHSVKSMKVYYGTDKKAKYAKYWYYDVRGNWVLWIETNADHKVIALSQRQIALWP